MEKLKPVSAGDAERIGQLLLEALASSGYLKPGSDASTRDKVRQLVRRLNIPADDAQTWLGIFRQILWKLRDG